MFEPYKVSWCSFVDEIAVDWLSVGMWFGKFSSLGTRMWTNGLVHPLFIAQNKWSGIPNFCNAKGEWVEYGV